MAIAGETDGKATTGSASLAPLATRLDLIKVLMEHPEYGLIFLVVLAADGALFLLILRSTDPTERLVMLGIFAVLLLATLVTLVFVVRILTPKTVVPPAMLAKSIPADEATRRSDLVYTSKAAPVTPVGADEQVFADNTFAFSQPPDGWTYELTTVEADAVRQFGQQLMGGEITESAVQLPFRAGRMVVFSAGGEHVIDYVPGRSTINGRKALGVLDERFRDQVRMFSVSKAGSLMREVTAEHVFVQLLSMFALAGVRVEEIGQEVFGDAGRSALAARCVIAVDGVTVDGQGPASFLLETRLYVVERAHYFYVLKTALMLGTAEAEGRARDIGAIIAGFQPVTPADAAERARLDLEAADASWTQAVAGVAERVLGTKATALLAQINATGVVSARQKRDATLLAEYAAVYKDMMTPEFIIVLEQFRDAVNAGDLAALSAMVPGDTAAEELPQASLAPEA